SLTCRPTETGSFPVALTIGDPLGGTTVLYATVLVNPPLVVNAVAAAPAPLDCGGPPASTVALSATVSGGTPPYTVNWTGPGEAHYSGLDIQPRLPGPGNFSFVVGVTDLGGGSSQTSISVLVDPATCASSSPSFWSSTGGITLGAGVAAAAGVLTVGLMWLVRRRRVRAAPMEPETPVSADSIEPP
ncbi:MAG TPA: hypothetical protein VGS18_02085, partial [Thermoplasmata archaeon]|nr:hypothetical protein [Thermoplasmata archaeon]